MIIIFGRFIIIFATLLEVNQIFYTIRRIAGPSSDAVFHMSRIEWKWEKSFVLLRKHLIRFMWSTTSEPGISYLWCNNSYYVIYFDFYSYFQAMETRHRMQKVNIKDDIMLLM